MNPNKPIITAVIVFSFVGHELHSYAADHRLFKHIEPSSFDPAAWPVQIAATGSGMFSSHTASSNYTGSGFAFDHINCTITR